MDNPIAPVQEQLALQQTVSPRPKFEMGDHRRGVGTAIADEFIGARGGAQTLNP